MSLSAALPPCGNCRIVVVIPPAAAVAAAVAGPAWCCNHRCARVESGLEECVLICDMLASENGGIWRVYSPYL